MAKEKVIKPHDFEIHKLSCQKCINVHTDQPKTLVECCINGAPLLRDYLKTLAAPALRKQNAALKRQFSVEADGKSYHASKRKLAEVMRYK
jgi:GrpB-like predicted nucleotidyltransferase (UPF0157 family)